ncbi:MAG TPA: MgtC/SapB family protein [Anaerolineae bacterium]|nr:MgtC/SapB family protein [Anaerolineae bacterium]
MPFISDTDLHFSLNLLLAAVYGGLIGFEREVHKRPAGLRTHILICVGAALFGMIATSYFSGQAEISRMWQNILTGVGFLAAGAVLKDEKSVHGLTTAAGIWVVAAIGLALAAQLYLLATIAEVILLITLFVLRWLEERYSPKPPDDKERG